MSNDFSMDGQKLIYHIRRLNEWVKGEEVYPIYADIGLSGGCNQRCVFCTFDYLDYHPVFIDTECIKNFIGQAAAKGLKSVLYAGEGEPLLHNQAGEIIEFTKNKGIDTALSTNGVFLNKRISDKILPYLSWVRVSINAGTPKKYSFIHGAKPDDFKQVLENLKSLVKIRDKNNYPCAIGAQSLLLPQNYKDILNLAAAVSDIGVDYLTIKPFSRHPSSKKKFDYNNISQKELSLLKEKLSGYQRNDFKVIYRQHSIDKTRGSKPYKKCLGFSFATRVTAEGDIFPCIAFEGKRDFLLGNIYQSSFDSIWEGARRKQVIDKIYSQWDINSCRKPCRLDEINRYLWNFKNPPNHVNFI
jgi:radical SAM protein with 4Fe4S-binding SPASM domain